MSYSQNLQQVWILEAIKQRRSTGVMTDEEPRREQIERLLEAATYAPNHHVQEAWHFFVVTGTAREILGDVMAEALELRLGLSQEQKHDAKIQKMLLKERMKPLRAPVIITVTVPHISQQEDFVERIEAGSAAVQNMLLAAHEMGLATYWRTGGHAYDPHVKNWFGLAPEDHIVGFVYVGFSTIIRQERVPTSFMQKTTWLS